MSEDDLIESEGPSPCATARPSGRFFLGVSAFTVYEAMAAQLRRAGWAEVRSPARLALCDLVLGDRFAIPYAVLRCERLSPSASRYKGRRWVNYFRGSHRLTLKASMARLLRHSPLSAGAAWLPPSFVLGGDQSRRTDDRNALLQEIDLETQNNSDGAVWIVKPSAGCKGRGIVLTRCREDMAAFIAALPQGGRGMFIAQRYVERPLLYDGRKFDLRVWALLRSPFDIFAYAQGSCRTASVPYDAADYTNTLAHLTNHCLQSLSADFGTRELGNELWLPALGAELCVRYGVDVLRTRLIPQVRAIIVRTLLAVREEIEVPPEEPFACFQLFGYDLIVDEELNVLLLEINGSPGVAGAHLEPLVAEMIALIDGGGDAPSEWDIEAQRFVRLWRDGDPIP